MALPDFLIAGVPKAGTTALHAALVRHPELFLPTVKEPKFFLTDGPPPATGGPGDVQTYQEHVWRRADYEALFDPAPPGTLRGEATPFYLYDRSAHRPDPRARPGRADHPACCATRSTGPTPTGPTCGTPGWSRRPTSSPPAAPSRRAGPPGGPTSGTTSPGPVRRAGAHLLQVFPREQVLLLRYRDLKDAPAATLDRVCDFLGVRTGLLTAIPRENVNRHVVRGQRRSTPCCAGCCASAARSATGSRCRCGWPSRGPLLTPLHRKRPAPGPADAATSGPRCCRTSPTTSRCWRTSPASATPTGCRDRHAAG